MRASAVVAQAVVSAAQGGRLAEEDVDEEVGSDSDLEGSLGPVGQSIQAADRMEDILARVQRRQVADRIPYRIDLAVEVDSSRDSLEEGSSEAQRKIHRDSRGGLAEAEQVLASTSSAQHESASRSRTMFNVSQ